MNNKNNRILVFGAAGFIGTYLIDELVSRGYNVIASDIDESAKDYYANKNIEYFKVDITRYEDFNLLPKYDYVAIVHLAAVQPANVSAENYNPINYINVNVIGTLNILNFCHLTKAKKLIYATSHRNTQGLWEQKKIISEKDGHLIKYKGQYSMFSISETAAQDCIRHYNEEYSVQGIILRLPPVYGYGPHLEIYMDGVPIKTGFQIFIENVQTNKPIEIWGDGNKGRDIIYIKDVINAFIKAIDNETAIGLYNISSGYKLTLKEEATTIAEVFGNLNNNNNIIYKPEINNNIEEFVYDISKAKKELGWEPKYNFRDMLLDIIKESSEKRYEYLLEKRKKEIINNIRI